MLFNTDSSDSCDSSENSDNYNDYYYNEDSKGKVEPFTKDQSKEVIYQLENAIYKLYKLNGSIGTAFACLLPYPDKYNLRPFLITNYHVLRRKDLKINKTIKITLDNDKTEKIILIDEDRITLPLKNFDASLVEIKPEKDDIHIFLDIDNTIYSPKVVEDFKNKSIYILQYPKGGISCFSSGLIKEIYNEKIRHFCSTEYGSSGGPILSISNLRVIGLHRKRTDEHYNEGIFIKYIIDELHKTYPINKNSINNDIKKRKSSTLGLNDKMIQKNISFQVSSTKKNNVNSNKD